MTPPPALRPLLLVWGFMATGKSTVAALVGARARARFIDLDLLVEEQQGASVEAIFSVRGEAAFRRIEQGALTALLAESGVTAPTVIALGGGALLDQTSRKRALEQAYVVTLTAEPDVIAARAAAGGRPLLATDRRGAIERLVAERREVYADAHRCIATDSHPPSKVADELLGAWRGWR